MSEPKKIDGLEYMGTLGECHVYSGERAECHAAEAARLVTSSWSTDHGASFWRSMGADKAIAVMWSAVESIRPLLTPPTPAPPVAAMRCIGKIGECRVWAGTRSECSRASCGGWAESYDNTEGSILYWQELAQSAVDRGREIAVIDCRPSHLSILGALDKPGPHDDFSVTTTPVQGADACGRCGGAGTVGHSVNTPTHPCPECSPAPSEPLPIIEVMSDGIPALRLERLSDDREARNGQLADAVVCVADTLHGDDLNSGRPRDVYQAILNALGASHNHYPLARHVAAIRDAWREWQIDAAEQAEQCDVDLPF